MCAEDDHYHWWLEVTFRGHVDVLAATLRAKMLRPPYSDRSQLDYKVVRAERYGRMWEPSRYSYITHESLHLPNWWL